jgi:hypothetical protein
MRVLALAVFMMALAADQSASAASCGKGMLWPYVRNPGDCLTDAEIAAGARGVYNGAVNTNPDLGAMQQNPAAVAAPAPALQSSVAAQQPIAVSPNGVPVATPAPAPAANLQAAPAADCSKGYLWPFVKKAGDCQSGEPKKAGVGTSVGGVGPGTQANAAAPAPRAPAPLFAANSGAVAATPAAAPAASTPVEPSCTKGALWPFVKKAGDCASSVEQKKGR